jgi:hypothetical protein
MKFTLTLSLLLLLNGVTVKAQEYFDGKFRIKNYTYYGYHYTLYDFSRDGYVMKAKYFAQNAYSQYLQWRTGKQILLVTAGAFSDTFESNGKPEGICVDNGITVNRVMRYDWDGMVIVYNGSTQQGGIAIVDLSQKPVTVRTTYPSGPLVSYYVKANNTDKLNFLNWGADQGVTLFQTMLVYSSDKSINTNLNNPYYGNKRERRFLAICTKNGSIHHVVVDAPDDLELNLSTSYSKIVLESDGFTVLYILNLDTGDKNVLQRYNGSYLQDMYPYKRDRPDRATIQNATNLLVYYKDN